MNIDILIRPETSSDVTGIRDVTRRAFAGRSYSAGNEQDLVDALRAQNALTISLVAEQGGRILGHIAFSPASAEDASPGWYTLGPVSVDPDVQRRGIGQALIIAGIGKLRELGASGCILVGDTGYLFAIWFRKSSTDCARRRTERSFYDSVPWRVGAELCREFPRGVSSGRLTTRWSRRAYRSLVNVSPWRAAQRRSLCARGKSRRPCAEVDSSIPALKEPRGSLSDSFE